jgi:metallo-beta-lactamase class B
MRIITSFLLLLSVTCSAQRLKITALTPNAFLYTTYNAYKGELIPSNGMYVVSDSGVVIIDSPWDTTQVQPLLDSIEARHHKKVSMCIATHYHDDRTGAFDYFRRKNIATWSSYQTKELCRIHKEKQAQHIFINDTIFTIGNLQFITYYPGEGHTKDNIVIWFDKEKILYGGCLVKSTESRDMGNVKDANLDTWPVAIERLLKLYPQALYIIPGHYMWGDKRTLLHTLKLLQVHKKN